MKRATLAALLAAALILAILPHPAAHATLGEALRGATAPGNTIGNVSVAPQSPTQIAVSWEGPAAEYEVRFGIPGGNMYYYIRTQDNFTTLPAVPDTEFWVTVVRRDMGEETPSLSVTTPAAQMRPGMGFTGVSFGVYRTDGDEGVDFWDDTTRLEFTRVTPEGLAQAGNGYDYEVAVGYDIQATDADKQLRWVLALRSPGVSDIYLDWGTSTVPGAWEEVGWWYGLNDHLQAYTEYNGAFASGTYEVELYMEDWLAGRTSFEVE